MEEDALLLLDELFFPPSDMRSTSRSPAMPVDERDWLPSRVVNGSDDDEMCDDPETSSAAAGTHTTPDAADSDPEADMDTSVPHHHDPTPYILDRPRFASPQTNIQSHSRNS
ncbi:hypothetical protein BGW80DRAFT_1462919 [Lactifluus volemus]|nr:hypothetical protein BGW80DRAFT_1462919 [Lactifluus volemus]